MNIGGFAFYVEEDAAEILERYLESIQKEYNLEPSRDEICSDIEERIGELLAEKSPVERIVTVEMVNYAKSVMGEFPESGEKSRICFVVMYSDFRLSLLTHIAFASADASAFMTNRSKIHTKWKWQMLPKS